MPPGPLDRAHLPELAQRILEQVNEAVAIITPDLHLAWVNDEFCRLTGYEREEITGQPLTLLRSGMHREGEYESMREAVFSEGRWHGEVWRRRKDGEAFPAWLTISAIRDENGEIVCFVDLFVDIDQVRHEREQLEFLVNHDPLTGLPNRRLFRDRLDNAVRRARRGRRRFGLLFVDLDNFKPLNDCRGHQAGDRYLIEVARALEECLRDSDTIARVGGDEFAIIAEEIEAGDNGRKLVRRVREAMERLRLDLPGGVEVGASLGLALYPRDGTDPADLYRAADAAMYAEKHQQR